MLQDWIQFFVMYYSLVQYVVPPKIRGGGDTPFRQMLFRVLFEWGYGPDHKDIALAITIRKNNRSSSCDNKVVELIGGAFACHPMNHLLFAREQIPRAVIINPDSYYTDTNQSEDCDPEILKAIGCYGMGPA